MTRTGKPNATGRSSGKPGGKACRNINPPKEREGLWVHLTLELLQAPVIMALSGNAQKVFFRLLAEHVAHGRFENGKLRVSQLQLSEQCDIRYQSIPKAVRELEAEGLVAVIRSGKILGKDAPNLYRLTMYGDSSLSAPPTNEWKRYRTIEEAKERIEAVEKRYIAERQKRPISMKQRKKAIEAAANVAELAVPEKGPLRGDL